MDKFENNAIEKFDSDNDLEYRKGCEYLGRLINYRENNFSPCCVAGRCPVVTVSGAVGDRLLTWQDYTTKLIDDIRNERPNVCEKCHLLKFGMWRKSVKLNVVNLGSNHPGDICNYKCVYCFSDNTIEEP